jgi:hypothetical protein
MGVPVHPSPTLFFAKRNEALDEGPPNPAATCIRLHEKVFKIADRPEAPGVEVKDVIGQANGRALRRTGKKASHRLARLQDAMPHAFGNRV